MSPADDKNIPKRRTLQTPGVAIVVLVLMIFLYSVDRFLAGLEHREVAAEGRRLYAAGQQLLKENRIPEAIDAFERARALERSNRNYSIALATAQLAGKQIEDARTTLNTILFQDSNYAPANLLMARTMVADQRYHEADSYYHRAIYGTWPNDQSQQRLNARLEVADMLAAHGGSYELLSEALLLQNTSGNNPAILKHVAGLLLQADSPARAAEVYQSVLRLNPRDMESYAGLARAEIQDGNYSAAHLALVKGFLHAPNDVNLRKEMELAGKLMSLDPTSRRLSSAEKFRRSNEILSEVRDEVSGCLGGKTAPPELQTALDQGNELLGEKLRGVATNEMAEARLSAAENLWQHRPLACGAPPPADSAIALLLKKINQ